MSVNARIRQRQRAAKFLWWWRFPYAVLVVITAVLLWRNFDGLVGVFLGTAIAGMGLGVIRIDPWRGRRFG